MIPLRYGGAFHAFKLILKEEGLKGLYRGFYAGFLAVSNVTNNFQQTIIFNFSIFTVFAGERTYANLYEY